MKNFRAESTKNEVQNRAEALATRNKIDNIEGMAMTADEFAMEGFNNAELAESAELDLDQAQNALDRAIWCFEQASDSALAAKARMHQLSIQFRLDLASSDEHGNDEATVEMKGTKVMESLVKECLLGEVLNVFYSIGPFLSSYTKEALERQFISKIRLAIQ